MNNEVVLLDTVEKCREFIKATRIGGIQIKALQQRDGKQVSIDEASDDQIFETAHAIADALNTKFN